MKLRNQLLISVLVGLLAMLLYSGPMWWGVLFSPIAQPLTTSGEAAEESGLVWESGEAEVRLKSLELLRGLFGQRR